MSLRRDPRAAASFAFGLLGLSLAHLLRDGALLVPFALLGAALLVGGSLAARELPRPRSLAPRTGRITLTAAGAF